MRFGLLGLSMTLAWFLVISTAASAIAAAVALVAARWWNGRHGTRPAGWLALRLLPSVAAGVFLVLAFGPSYLEFEPLNGTEPLKAPLMVLALGGGVLVALAAGRTIGAARRLRQLERGWRTRAVQAPDGPDGLPVWHVDGTGVVATLVGVFRPRLYLSSALAATLTRDERIAVLAHEAAHRRRRDNLARWLMLATPDVFAAMRVGRHTAEQWAAATEHRADEAAMGDDPGMRVALASALVKVARLLPPPPRRPLPTSGLDDGNILAERVTRLLGDQPPTPRHLRAWLSAGTIAGVAGVVLFASAELAIHQSVHRVTEWLVRVSW